MHTTPLSLESGEARAEGDSALPRGTRGKALSQFAFEVAHLAAGGLLFALSLQLTLPLHHLNRHAVGGQFPGHVACGFQAELL